MKSLADDGGVVPRRAKTRRFQLVWTPYTGQIRGRDVARTTFHTVSLETVWNIARGLLGCGHSWCTVSKNSASWPLVSDLQRPSLRPIRIFRQSLEGVFSESGLPAYKILRNRASGEGCSQKPRASGVSENRQPRQTPVLEARLSPGVPTPYRAGQDLVIGAAA